MIDGRTGLVNQSVGGALGRLWLKDTQGRQAGRGRQTDRQRQTGRQTNNQGGRRASNQLADRTRHRPAGVGLEVRTWGLDSPCQARTVRMHSDSTLAGQPQEGIWSEHRVAVSERASSFTRVRSSTSVVSTKGTPARGFIIRILPMAATPSVARLGGEGELTIAPGMEHHDTVQTRHSKSRNLDLLCVVIHRVAAATCLVQRAWLWMRGALRTGSPGCIVQVVLSR